MRRWTCFVVVLRGVSHPAVAAVSLERAPQRDEETLLYLPLGEPDEAILIGDRLAIDPVYLRMEAKYKRGRFGDAPKFTGRPGLRQCMLVSLPQRFRRERHGSRKPTIIARMGDRAQVEVDVPKVLTDTERSFTIEFRVFPQVLQNQTIISGVNTAVWGPEAPWQVDLTADGRLRYACGSGLHRFEMLSDRTVPIGRWTHAAGVCDTGDFRIYLNGSPEGGSTRNNIVARKRFFFVFLDPLARPGEDRICATHKLKYGGNRGPVGPDRQGGGAEVPPGWEPPPLLLSIRRSRPPFARVRLTEGNDPCRARRETRRRPTVQNERSTLLLQESEGEETGVLQVELQLDDLTFQAA